MYFALTVTASVIEPWYDGDLHLALFTTAATTTVAAADSTTTDLPSNAGN